MLLKNSNIELRAVEPEDLDILYKWENDTELWTYGNTLSPYSKLTLRQYINDAQQMDIFQSKQLRLMVVVRENNATVGTVDLYDIDVQHKRAGIGILIDKAYRNKSLASQTLKLVADYAFNFLNLHQLYAYISESNRVSVRLFEKAGYQFVGTLKEWIQKGKAFENVCVVQLIND